MFILLHGSMLSTVQCQKTQEPLGMGFGKKNYKLQRIETLEKGLSDLQTMFVKHKKEVNSRFDEDMTLLLKTITRETGRVAKTLNYNTGVFERQFTELTEKISDCELEIDGIHAELEEIQDKGFVSKTGVATKTKNDQKPLATTKYLRAQTNAVPVPMTTTSVQQEKAGDLAAWWGGESKVDKKLDQLAGMIQGIGHRTAEQLEKMDHDMRLITRRLDQIEENENPTQSQRVEPSNPLYKQPPP